MIKLKRTCLTNSILGRSGANAQQVLLEVIITAKYCQNNPVGKTGDPKRVYFAVNNSLYGMKQSN